MENVEIWTDGACQGNPGPGGWAYVIVHDGTHTSASGYEPSTTNNIMELRAVIEALTALTQPSTARIHLDSRYIQRAFTDGWLRNWQQNGWRTRAKQPVKNRHLWEALLLKAGLHRCEWVWIPGHTGIELNETVDLLAKTAIATKGRTT